MRERKPVNISQSVRDKLLTISRERNEDNQYLMTRYANERFLYRLSKSEFKLLFILKGASLFFVWNEQRHRATRDMDFTVEEQISDSKLKQMIETICRTDVAPDGVEFDAASIQVEGIRDEQAYGGTRVRLSAKIGTAEIPLQVDVGYGDALPEKPRLERFPTLLEFEAPEILIYPVAAVVAKKLEAMVSLGIANSRMKDFYDVWKIAISFDLSADELARAVKATFTRRTTQIPDGTPFALTEEFSADPERMRQWSAFLTRLGISEAPSNFQEVTERISELVLPALDQARRM